MYGIIVGKCNESSTLFQYNQTYDNELIDTDEESALCDAIAPVFDFINRFYVAIIFFGLAGNLLSFTVFLKTSSKMRSSSYYPAAWSITDFIFLTALLFVWIHFNLGWNTFNRHGWCELVVYTSSVCSSLSAWLIVAYTVERFIAVRYPLQRPRMCTISRAKIIIVVLSIIALIFHSYTFFTAGIIKIKRHNSTEETCGLIPEYLNLMSLLNTVDSIISLIIPLILIVVTNGLIVKNVRVSGRQLRRAPSVSYACVRTDMNRHRIPVNTTVLYYLLIFIN